MTRENKKTIEFMGIDLGTTTSQVSIIDSAGNVQILPNIDGDLSTLSVVSVAGDKPTVGKVAKQDVFLSPDHVAEQFKKQMGAVTEDGDHIPVVTGPDGTANTAVDLSAMIVRYLKESAEKLSGGPIKKAVISVPAHFKRVARQATKDAGRIAGFDEVYIVDEPTSAATFYGLSKGKDQITAVVDLGGGTLDVSILKITESGCIDPIAVDGDPECGGSNVDEALHQMAQEFVDSKGGKLDPDHDLADFLEVLEHCKRAKEMLARKDKAIVPLRVGNERFSMEVTYDQMRQASTVVIDTTRNCCQRALSKSGLGTSEINSVVLVGGSSRLRFVSEIVKEVFGQEPVTDTDPDMAVAKGDAILAAAHFATSDRPLLIEGKVFRAGAVKASQIAGRVLCAAIVTKKDKGDLNEYNFPIIPSGAKLPYSAIECFSPLDSQQASILIKLIDGPAGELSSHFTPLQEAEVSVQPTTEAINDDRIEFTIKMDTEGMVDITVRDKVLNKPVPINFKYPIKLSDAEIKEQRDKLEK
ncbi:MAG: Hsp70 family protein [Phycisphaeraceae bacterium]|nr:Hsp70 family protein [Phycisphaeraceae bacterium]